MTAANIENLLIAPPRNRIDHLVTQALFPDLAAPDHDEALQHKTPTNPKTSAIETNQPVRQTPGTELGEYGANDASRNANEEKNYGRP